MKLPFLISLIQVKLKSDSSLAGVVLKMGQDLL